MNDDSIGKVESSPSYEELCEVPNRIAQMRAGAKIGTSIYAFLLQCELFFRFILALPWRTRILCACRITGFSPNLFKSTVGPNSGALASWVQDEVEINPDAQFWQYRFTPADLGASTEQQGFLPRDIVPLLEEYLACHRPLLLRGNDPGTLFVGKSGHALSPDGLNKLIRYSTPFFSNWPDWPNRAVHFCRRAFALAWLAKHPGDFVGLSRILQDSNVAATIRKYKKTSRN